MAGTDDNKPNDSESAANDIERNEQNEDNVREEYILLDTKLDELNQALDLLEQKNDDIHKRLTELLQSNRDIRQQLRHENAEIN
ncbi:UPF0184 protein AAEL002161 [Melitaea cinxia]|uniref:UPF0184 protein AAEL002161 n=1 Tax=Melitaea cinxia TaxID=113334 RepID=UPI001E2747E3|nr:UPF0184 protein AAEL002161 [Melitaea cinxia]